MKTKLLLVAVLTGLFSNNLYSQSNTEEMVTTAEKLEIMELIAGYSLASDQKDVEAHMDYYTDDGYISGGMQTGPKNGSMSQDLEQIFQMEGTLKRHFALNHQFSKQDDVIHVKYLLLVAEGEQMPGVLATGQIEDQFVQVDGKWKLNRHHIIIDPAMYKMMEQQNKQD